MLFYLIIIFVSLCLEFQLSDQFFIFENLLLTEDLKLSKFSKVIYYVFFSAETILISFPCLFCFLFIYFELSCDVFLFLHIIKTECQSPSLCIRRVQYNNFCSIGCVSCLTILHIEHVCLISSIIPCFASAHLNSYLFLIVFVVVVFNC